MPTSPKISIITVVYNAGNLLESTILSIKNQTYSHIEYIIVDGASVDGTLDVIRKYETDISKWISERDKGIYDAMNKGLSMASGEYILFLNAGDRLYKPDVLANVLASPANCDVYYGETMIIDKTGKEIGPRRLKAPEELNWRSLLNGMLVCHQSFIVKRSIAPFYNTRLKIASDYAWMLECLKASQTICNTGVIISGFLDGGMNKKNIALSLRERFRTMVRHYGLPATLFQHFVIAAKFFWFVGRYRRF